MGIDLYNCELCNEPCTMYSVRSICCDICDCESRVCYYCFSDDDEIDVSCHGFGDSTQSNELCINCINKNKKEKKEKLKKEIFDIIDNISLLNIDELKKKIIELINIK